MKKSPLVTVIIPTYNYGHFIKEAIESVLASDYPPNCIEIIIIDDGSTDNTADIVKCYLFNNNIRYIYMQNTKKAGATRLGIELAKGKYIFNLDADDVFESGKLKKVVEIFEGDEEIVHVSHINNHWSMRTGLKKKEKIPSKLLNRKISGDEALIYLYTRKLKYGGGSTYAARIQSIKNNLYINLEMGTIIDDYLAISTMSLGYTYFIDEPLTLHRIHNNNDSKTINTNGRKNTSKLKNRLACIMAIEQQLKQSYTVSNTFKRLYELRTKEYSIYLNKIEQKKSFCNVVDLHLFLLKNIRYFGKHLMPILYNYKFYKYLIPTPLFLPIRNVFKE